MDETPRQLIGQVRSPIEAEPSRPAREDYEYVRWGSCNVFMACEPLAGWCMVRAIAEAYSDAERITLVMDNLNTHSAGSLYEAFPPEEARALRERFEFVYTPRHGSWLKMAEIELQVLIGQCLKRRIDCIETVCAEVAAWQRHRNHLGTRVN
ncbi:DDE superfamily endonuclease [Azotobacter chroococcum]|uniref:DDE superfamily endonuclease n=1 Tax=Azotobacter chroococcum TaxID=353 RepID=A0A4R1PPV3_9GAMM|nr:hypothetical protein E0E53_20045 [Azotobacter chroococcum]TCL32846.1 DDE superfamily endonuclease [Azotobacter chroococcum]